MQNTIITERLILNLLALGDHDFILRLVNSKGWIEFIGDRNVHTQEDAIAYINKIISSQNIFYWVVRIKDENTPIGIISFLKRTYLEHFDIGFAFLPEFNGDGYAFEASKEVLSIMGKRAEYFTILATTVPQNVNSIKLLNKLGLHFEKETEVENIKLHIYSNSNVTFSIEGSDREKNKTTSEFFFDSISDNYTKLISKCVPRYNEMLANLMKYLPDDFHPHKILELGCGSGNLSSLIIRKFPFATITAVDISGEILEAAKNRLGKLQSFSFIKADFRELYFGKGEFDLILSSISLHHLRDEEKRALFQNCFAWLGQNGCFSFSDQFSSPLPKIYSQNISEWHDEAIAMGSTEAEWDTWMEHQHKSDFHSPVGLQLEWLAKAGFENIDITWRYLLWCNIIAMKRCSQ